MLSRNQPVGCLIIIMTWVWEQFCCSCQRLQTMQRAAAVFLCFPVMCPSRHLLWSCCNAAVCNTQVAITTLTALGWITWGLLRNLLHHRPHTSPMLNKTNALSHLYPVFVARHNLRTILLNYLFHDAANVLNLRDLEYMQVLDSSSMKPCCCIKSRISNVLLKCAKISLKKGMDGRTCCSKTTINVSALKVPFQLCKLPMPNAPMYPHSIREAGIWIVCW